MNYIIKTQNLSYEYQTDSQDKTHPAVKDINLDIEKGSFTVILGHNGSGKSTLAKLFSGILQPTSGKVFVNGIDTENEQLIYDVKKSVGMVFQNPDNQLVATVVEEDIAFAPENLGLPPEEIRRRVDEALEIVSMKEYAHFATHKLSGGQKQRVAIAGILAMKPDCIIFDESTAMLDPYGRREIMNTIKKLNKEENITVILITHYMDEASEADRVIVMNDGKVEMDSDPRSIFSRGDELEKIGLDVPQITQLMYMLKESGFDDVIPDGVYSEEEALSVIKDLIGKEDNGRN